MRRAAWFLLALPLAGACFPDLPPEYRVEDLRVLDVRVRPPEVAVFRTSDDPLSFDPKALPPVAGTQVEVTALVAHPDLDASFGYDWLRCTPGLGRIPCDGASAERLTERPGPVLDFSPIDLLLGDLASGGSLTELGGTLAGDPRDLLNGLYGFVNLTASVKSAATPVDTLSLGATKRVVIFEPRLVAYAVKSAKELLAGAPLPAIEGLPSLCADVTPAQYQAIETFLRQRVPNQPPSLRALHFRSSDQVGTGTQAIHAAEVLAVPPGTELELSAALTSTEAESYSLIDANCQIQRFKETLVLSWFTQLGTLTRHHTTLESPTTYWLSPPAEALEGNRRARIWAVLRDGRGGSDHLWFDVQLE